MALDCCGDHPSADVLCLDDLSFPSLVQEYANSVLLSEATSWPHFDSQISCFFFRVSHRRPASHLHPSSSLRSSSNQSPLFKHLAFFYVMSKDISEELSFLFFFFAVALVVGTVVVVLRVCRVPRLQNAHWHVTVCIRVCTASSSSCLTCMTTRSHIIVAFHVVLFGDCSQSFVSVFYRPLFHFFNDLHSCCLVLVELEGSIGFGSFLELGSVHRQHCGAAACPASEFKQPPTFSAVSIMSGATTFSSKSHLCGILWVFPILTGSVLLVLNSPTSEAASSKSVKEVEAAASTRNLRITRNFNGTSVTVCNFGSSTFPDQSCWLKVRQ